MADGGQYKDCANCCGRGAIPGRHATWCCPKCGGTGRVRAREELKPMRIAVVGMLKRQEQLVRAHEFKNLDIRFANKGTKYGISENFSNYDRILVMTKFVSHSLTDSLDRSKTTLVHGGFGKLRGVLETLNTAARLGEPAPAPIALMSPDQDEEDEMEKLDFKALKTAKEGDVLEFQRPPKTTLAHWELKIAQMRSYYKRTHGVHTEVSFKDGTAQLLVTKVAPAKVLTEAERAEQEVVAAGKLEHDYSNVQRGPVIATAGSDREFWMTVVAQSMRNNPGAPASQHVEYANAIIDGLRAKLGYVAS